MDNLKRMQIGLIVAVVLAILAVLPGPAWVHLSRIVVGKPLPVANMNVAEQSDAINDSTIAVDDNGSTFDQNNQSIADDSASSAEPAAIPASTSELAAPTGSILADGRVLTFYGHPYDARMGILGELSDSDLVSALYQRAAMYEEAGGLPVQPAIELIACVAQDNPGEDGLYRARTSPDVIQYYADLAAANGMLLVLDVQVGHSNVMDEVEAILPFLQQSNVHLAIDPEFDMWGGDVPGDVIGSTTAAAINYAQGMLSQIVAEQGGPNKMLIVHQFTPYMISDKGSIVDDPNVDLAIVMDGFGTADLKIKHYNMFVRDEPVEYGGIKLFFTQDTPLMSPDEVMALEPMPDVIIYQ